MTRAPHRVSGGACYGIYTNPPPLPEGYHWLQSPHDWVLVRDEAGDLWFVRMVSGGILLIRREEAGIWDWLRTLGKLKLGTIYADYRYTILLPNPAAPRVGA